jgi:hypothetical protein
MKSEEDHLQGEIFPKLHSVSIVSYENGYDLVDEALANRHQGTRRWVFESFGNLAAFLKKNLVLHEKTE